LFEKQLGIPEKLVVNIPKKQLVNVSLDEKENQYYMYTSIWKTINVCIQAV